MIEFVRVHGRSTLRTAIVVLTLASGEASAQMRDTTIFGWSSRKLQAVVLSTIIPGSGQSFLGHSTKGTVITLGFFGSGLITLLAENNAIGRNERLSELNALYSQTTNWTEANLYWNQMRETRDILVDDVKRRDLFLKVTAAFWIASVVDIVFFSEDLGEQAFGSAFIAPGASMAFSADPSRGMVSSFTYRF